MKCHERTTRGQSHRYTWTRGKVDVFPLGAPLRVSSYCRSVRERPPRCLISYIIRETAGRGCRQLTRGCRGRINCDFWRDGGEVGAYSHLMSSVSGSCDTPQRTANFTVCTFQLLRNKCRHLQTQRMSADSSSKYVLSQIILQSVAQKPAETLHLT